jgi:hypothetical protein
MSDTLDAQGVTAAIVTLTSNFANQPFGDSVKDAWRRKLATLKRGEFRPALDAWFDGPRGKWRPEVGEFWEIVRAQRAQRCREQVVAEHPDGPPPEPDPARNLAGLAAARAQLISTPPPVPSPFGGERGPASPVTYPVQGHPGGGVDTLEPEVTA